MTLKKWELEVDEFFAERTVYILQQTVQKLSGAVHTSSPAGFRRIGLKFATASEPHKGTRKTNISTIHMPHHTRHERPNTHYGACSAWFVVGALGATRSYGQFLVFFCIKFRW
jgi:hypothetical protein